MDGVGTIGAAAAALALAVAPAMASVSTGSEGDELFFGSVCIYRGGDAAADGDPVSEGGAPATPEPGPTKPCHAALCGGDRSRRAAPAP